MLQDHHDSASMRLGEQGWQSYSFGPFEFFPERQLLLKGGVPVRIGGRALELLTALVRNPGGVLSKRALIAHAWPGVVVDEANLKVNMSALRRALGDEAAAYISTVTGRGYCFVAPVQVGTAPPPSVSGRTTQAKRNNLPIGTTRILGRAAVIESISRDLSTSRLVSIVGAGGVGKTTVAIGVAEGFLDRFRDGVWFVDLATIEDNKQLPGAIAMMIGSGTQRPNSVDALCELLADRELLLLLDSCEHMVDKVAEFASRILASAKGVALLVTSRQALMLNDERVRCLPGLTVPPASQQLAAAEAMTFSAIQLFVERATESCETFQLSNELAPIVADVCRQLDGLALAIELAATRVDAFGVRGLQIQLSDHVLPRTRLRSGPQRHRTLAATIEWSYDLLSETEARVVRAMSAFAGSFNAQGAAAVADVSASEATEALASLVAKSLLSIDIESDGIAYRLLETTRSFCIERLRQDGSHSPIMQRHARYICDLLHRTTSEWAQRPNQALAANYDRALTDLYAAICTSTMTSQSLMFQAMDAMRRAVEIAANIGDVESQRRSLPILGTYELFVGDPRSALCTFERFSAVAASHAPDAVIDSEALLGTAELFLGRLQASRSRLERLREQDLQLAQSSVQAAQTSKDDITTFAVVLPHPRWLTGSPEGAIHLARYAIAHVTDQTIKNAAFSYACPVAYWCGFYEESRRYASMLGAHSEAHGFHPRRPIARLYLAALDIAEGNCGGERIHSMQSAIEELRIANHLARMPYHLCLLAEGLIEHKRYEEAAIAINASLDSIRDQGEAWCLPEVLRVRARMLFERDDNDGAEGTLLVAMQKAKEIGALSWELRAANDLAALWLRQAKATDAAELLASIYSQFNEGHATRDLRTAAQMLRTLASFQPI